MKIPPASQSPQSVQPGQGIAFGRARENWLIGSMLKRIFLLPLLVLAWGNFLFAQGNDSLAEMPASKPALQMGLRFSYQLQFTSKNYVQANNFSFFEAGHHLGYGAFLNIPLSYRTQLVPVMGLEHVFWPKSLGYSPDCMQDSFPTFISVADSLPGRDFRFYNLSFELGLKVRLPRNGIFFKIQPIFSLNIRREIEQYNHTCGLLPQSHFVDYTNNDFRRHQRFNWGLGLGIVKEVALKKGVFLALEPGFKVMVSRLLAVKDENPNGPSFSLYPWGFYLNLSIFR